MNNIILSADSTCDLGRELTERYHIHLYPLHVLLEGKDHLDGVDIRPDDIYQAFYDRKVLPQTAAVNVAEYQQHFRRLTADGSSVIHICLGGALSSSYQNCVLAAREIDGVYAVDSRNLSTGMGLLVLEGARMIGEGMEAAEIAGRLQEEAGLCHASFILDTLTFMHAGGRCSAVTALGASILQLKPCIEVDNSSGAMHVGKKYRGNLEKVLPRYTADQLHRYPSIDPRHVFITHSGIDDSLIRTVRETIEREFSFREIHVTRAGCTISSHCGPNTLGVLFMTKP